MSLNFLLSLKCNKIFFVDIDSRAICSPGGAKIIDVIVESHNLNQKIGNLKTESDSSNSKISNIKAESNNLNRKNSNTINQSPKGARQHIPLSTQRKIYSRDKCCQYKNKLTGKQCRCQWQLNIDHIKPVWANGSNESANLRVLCANHNREIYRQQANMAVKS